MTSPNQPDPDLVEPRRNGKGASVPGPRSLPREAQARDLVRPSSTGKGSLPNLRWSFADSRNRLEAGHLNIGGALLDAMPTAKHPVMPA